MIHWCNPLVWFLRSSFEQVCECSCDEIVMCEKTEAEVNEYLRLMIDEAREDKKENVSLRWKSGFGGNARKMKERMENLMSKKKWNRAAAVALVAALTFANSMTVFAYRDGFEREVSENASEEQIEKMVQSDAFVFVPEETDGESVQEFKESEMLEYLQNIQYDRQFVDETGNIYPITEDEMIEPHCDHTFVSGTSYDHIKNSSGGCEVLEFHAQRCSKCGYVKMGDLISTHTYVKCPH